jgi:hypothetical protein
MHKRIELQQNLKRAQADLAKALSTTPQADLRVAEIPDRGFAKHEIAP